MTRNHPSHFPVRPSSENPVDNPYRPPQSEVAEPDRQAITDGDVRVLRRCLLGFGIVGFIGPILLAFVTDYLRFDVLALCIGLVGMSVTRQSFATFPWTAILLLLYPLAFLATCDWAHAFDLRAWYVPERHSDAPLAFCLVQSTWALLNAGLVYRFHILQRRARP